MKRVCTIGIILWTAGCVSSSNGYAYDYKEGRFSGKDLGNGTVLGIKSINSKEGGRDWKTWTACSANEECVAIHDACGGWTAVNGQFQQEAQKYENELATVVECNAPKLEPEPKVLCLNQICTVKPAGFDFGVK